MCRRPPTWLALPDRKYERLADNDALYCGETEPHSDGELIALCDYHSDLHRLGLYGGEDKLAKALDALELHSLGIYGDDKLAKILDALASGIQTEERNI